MKKSKQRTSLASSTLVDLHLIFLLSFVTFCLNDNVFVKSFTPPVSNHGVCKNKQQQYMQWKFWENDTAATSTEEKEETVEVNGQKKKSSINQKADVEVNKMLSVDSISQENEQDVQDQLSEILLYRMQKQKNKSNKNNNKPIKPSGDEKVYPFVIDLIKPKSDKQLYRDAAQVCVEVFFNADDEVLGGGLLGGMGNGNGKNAMSPFKAMQLAYLRNLQYGDLRGRQILSNAQNSMFVAREVIPSSTSSSENVITDLSAIYNSECLANGETSKEYTRGDYLGFVEVTERSFGLGKKFDEAEGNGDDEEKIVVDAEGKEVSPKKKKLKLRPLLTNLSVRSDARQSGIGSALLTSAESAVLTWDRPQYNEIILQVEDDNSNAMQFYEKRGYMAVFADPACRRFATDGLMLRKERCTKIAMRKVLTRERAMIGNDKAGKEGGIGDMFRKLPFFLK